MAVGAMQTRRSEPRRRERSCQTAVLLLVLVPRTGHAGAADDKPIDLLRLPAAKVEATTALGGDASRLAALTDGDAATAATIAAGDGVPLDMVYGFGNAVVSPEGIRITLPAKAAPDAVPATVEILVSTLSSNAGSLVRLPKDGHLTGNAIAAWDAWAHTYHGRQGLGRRHRGLRQGHRALSQAGTPQGEPRLLRAEEGEVTSG